MSILFIMIGIVSNLFILMVTFVVSRNLIVSICVIYLVSVTSEITSVSEILLSLLITKYVRAISSININMFFMSLIVVLFTNIKFII